MLKRGTLNEQEFATANEAARAQKAALESRKAELEELVSKERGRTDLDDRLPEVITGVLEAFEGLDIRQQKANRQSILKAAYVCRDGRIELEFRES